MHGVFLHILGDAFGSVIVIVTAIIIVWQTDANGDIMTDISNNITHLNGSCKPNDVMPTWVWYLDPSMRCVKDVLIFFA